jgi:hypothetical protein
MSDAVAGVAAASRESNPERILLERGPESARTISALRYALDAMRTQRSPAAREAATPAFRAEMQRQAASEPQAAARAEPSPPIAPPSPPPAALSVAVEPASARSTPPVPTPPVPTMPVPTMPAASISPELEQWTRGINDGSPVYFDEAAPSAIVAPDISALAGAEENLLPRDVLEIMRARHLGPQAGGGNGR